MGQEKKKTLEELIEIWWTCRSMFHGEEMSDELFIALNNSALTEVVGSLDNYADIQKVIKFADRMHLSAEANRALTKKQIDEQAEAVRSAAERIESIFKQTGTNYTLQNMLKEQTVKSLLAKLTAISAGAGGMGSGGGGASGLGLIFVALVLGASSERAQAKGSLPDPRVFNYQQYLIKWLSHAITTLKTNGGNLQVIKKPKTFQQWLANPGH